MKDLTQQISAILTNSASPALLCSWGRDSSVLLHYAQQVKPDIAIYFFGDKLPESARRAVVNEGLAICSFAPADRYLGLDGEMVTLIEEYSFNGVRVPMLSKVEIGDECAHGFPVVRTPAFHFPNDVILWGYRKSDSHSLIPRTFEREIQLGHTRFVAPLYDWTDEQVESELRALGLQSEADEAVKICKECFDAALAGFQERTELYH